mmetsp:Transcript_4214/g.6951  ORF Transcript_4214/g.6951 Transcript_4214/m.6951 type:complete len:80 (+) Transcript_4214:407-646(+)
MSPINISLSHNSSSMTRAMERVCVCRGKPLFSCVSINPGHIQEMCSISIRYVGSYACYEGTCCSDTGDCFKCDTLAVSV